MWLTPKIIINLFTILQFGQSSTRTFPLCSLWFWLGLQDNQKIPDSLSNTAAGWGSLMSGNGARAVSQRALLILCVAKFFTAWKLDSERKYPKGLKVAAADLWRLGLGNYTACFCFILSVKTNRFKRRGETPLLNGRSGKEITSLFVPLQQPRSSQRCMSCRWRIVKGGGGGEEENPFSKVIHTLHHWQWVFVAPTKNSTLF